MTVHVRHLLMIELHTSTQGFFYQQLACRVVQNVPDSAFAQFFRLPVLVRKVFRIEYLSCFQIPNFQFSAYKRQIHFMHIAAVWLVGKYFQTHHQAFVHVSHLPFVLVAELTGYQTFVTVLLVFVHFLSEAQGTGRKVMTKVFAQGLDGGGHHVPVVFFTHQFAVVIASVIKLDTSIQHGSIHRIFPGKFVCSSVAGRMGSPIQKIGYCSLIQHIV